MLNKNNKLNNENLSNISGGIVFNAPNLQIYDKLSEINEFLNQIEGNIANLSPTQKVQLTQYQQLLNNMCSQMSYNGQPVGQGTYVIAKKALDTIKKLSRLKAFKHARQNITIFGEPNRNCVS